MLGDKVKIILSLSPALLIIILLFFGGIFYGLLQSLGYQPAIGKYEINLDAYYNVMFAERYSKLFWTGLGLNLWVSFVANQPLLSLDIQQQDQILKRLLKYFDLPQSHQDYSELLQLQLYLQHQ